MGEYNRNKFISINFDEALLYKYLARWYNNEPYLYDIMFGPPDPWKDEYYNTHQASNIFEVYQRINKLWDEIKTRFSYLPEEKLKRKFKKYLKHPQWEYVLQALFKSYDMTVGRYAIRKEYVTNVHYRDLSFCTGNQISWNHHQTLFASPD